VMGILKRGGEVRTAVVSNRKKHALQTEVRKHVEAGAALYTDALLSYEGLASDYAHKVLTMRLLTWMVACILVGWRIFGAY
jgi:transposase-like protein